jgi:hypothetical protein
MGFIDWKRERFIRKVLTRISRQRVAIILQPGNVWAVERAVSEDQPNVAEALRTCHMRGWVEPLSDAIPKANFTPKGNLTESLEIKGSSPIYRLTEGGWNVIKRTHGWIILTFIIAAATLFATLIGIYVTVLLQ